MWIKVNKKLSYCWETVRRESMPRIAEVDVEMKPRLNDLQIYFKVIKSGTNRKLVYDFLLVVYSNFCRITHCFWEIWCETVQWPWNMSKVIDSRIIWKLSCGHGVKCSEDSERMKWKSPFSMTPLSFDALSPANPPGIFAQNLSC